MHWLHISSLQILHCSTVNFSQDAFGARVSAIHKILELGTVFKINGLETQHSQGAKVELSSGLLLRALNAAE